MMLLYTLLVFLLGAAKLLIQRKASALARKYSQVAQQTDKMLRETVYKEGNSARLDPYQTAKKHYLLGCMVEKKERLEAKHFSWQARAERFGKFVARVRGWRGKVLPYVVGATDVLVSLGLIEVYHLQDVVGLTQVTQWLTGLISR
jgi:hypothetical protein